MNILVNLEDELVKKIDARYEELGYRSRTAMVRDVVRHFAVFGPVIKVERRPMVCPGCSQSLLHCRGKFSERYPHPENSNRPLDSKVFIEFYCVCPQCFNDISEEPVNNTIDS